MKRLSKLLSSNGFSLAELVISLGVMGVLALGVTEVMKRQTISTKISESSVDSSSYLNMVQYKVFGGVTPLCENVFPGFEVAGPEIILTKAELLARGVIDANFSIANIDLDRIILDNRREEGQPIASAGTTTRIYSYSATAIFNQTSQTINESGGNYQIRRKLPFPILLEVDISNANAILRCADRDRFLSDKSQEYFCSSVGGSLVSTNNAENELSCVFNDRNDPVLYPQSISGISNVVETANVWAGFGGTAAELIVSNGDGNGTMAFSSSSSQPNLVEEVVAGEIRVENTLTNPPVIVTYVSGNELGQNSDFTPSTMAQLALTNCWLTTNNCDQNASTAGIGTPAVPQLNPDGGLALAACGNGTGISRSGCTNSSSCPPGYYPTGIKTGNGLTEQQQQKGEFTCRPLVQNASCPRGAAAELITLPTGEVTVNCAAAPPTISQYQCLANATWSATGLNGPPTCTGVTGACTSGAAGTGAYSCCTNYPVGSCLGSGPPPPVDGACRSYGATPSSTQPAFDNASGCTAGVYVDDPSDPPTEWRWYCNGTGGGAGIGCSSQRSSGGLGDYTCLASGLWNYLPVACGSEAPGCTSGAHGTGAVFCCTTTPSSTCN